VKDTLIVRIPPSRARLNYLDWLEFELTLEQHISGIEILGH